MKIFAAALMFPCVCVALDEGPAPSPYTSKDDAVNAVIAQREGVECAERYASDFSSVSSGKDIQDGALHYCSTYGE